MKSTGEGSRSGGASEEELMDVGVSPKKTPTKKRKPESRDDDSEPAPKRSKPVCKYGPKCYQTNAKHREEFEHPLVS